MVIKESPLPLRKSADIYLPISRNPHALKGEGIRDRRNDEITAILE
jgi:hypothetical protein